MSGQSFSLLKSKISLSTNSHALQNNGLRNRALRSASKPPKKAGGLSGIENVSQAGRQPLAQPLQSQYPRLGPHQILCGPSSAKLTGSRRARIWRLQGLVAFTYHCVSGAVRETRLAKHKQVTEMPGPVIISAKSVDYLLNQRSGEPARFSTVIKMHDCTRQTLFLYPAACDS